MEKIVQKTAEKYIKERGRKKRWQKVVTAMAAVVVFCTTYALIMPAVTQQGQAFCGVDEHKEHTADCYETKQVLTCTLSEEGHEHSSECFKVQPVLSCDILETDGHLHDESCYAEDGSLICEEIECEPHHHSDSCYTTEEICVCGLEEQPPHQHSEACYTTEETLVCELPIHEHSLQCFSNPEADIETSSVWERSFADITLSKNWSKDVLAIASTQIGYAESSRNYQVQDDGVTMKGYSRYGDWYGIPYGDWCAMFCSFCMHYAEVDPALMPMESGCQNWVEKLSAPALNLYHAANNERLLEQPIEEKYIPAPGDLIFFDWDTYDPKHPENRDADHVGFVAEIIFDEATNEPTKIRTIEGNWNDEVCCNYYSIDDERILGYGELPENPEENYVTIESTPAADGAVAVISGNLPEGAEAVIEAVNLTQDELEGYFGAEKAAQMTGFVAYDIKIIVDGEEWQPDESVSVVVKQTELTADENESFAVAHVDDETSEVADLSGKLGEDGEITFDTDGFSLYIFYTFTVDFHYDDVTFSINGMDSVLLSDLFNALGIERSVNEVVSVSFSNDDLIQITALADGDWNLSSLQAFSSEEELTVLFNDGTRLIIRVTDAQADSNSRWELVTSTSQLSADDTYIIVGTRSSSYYLMGANGTTATASSVSLISQSDGSYKLDNAPTQAQHWGITANGSSLTVRNANNGNYLRLSSSTILSSSSNTVNGAYTTQAGNTYGGYWRFNNGDYYLYCTGSAFSRSTSNASYRPLQILRLLPTDVVWCYHNGASTPYAKYGTLHDATVENADLRDGDIIELHGDTSETKQTVIQKSITVKSAVGEIHTVDFGTSSNNFTYVAIPCDKHADPNFTSQVTALETRDCMTVIPATFGAELNVLFENITFDGLTAYQSATLNDHHLLQLLHGAEVTLSGVTIQNFDIAAGCPSNGVVSLDGRTTVDDGGCHLVMNNGTVIKDCNSYMDAPYNTGGIAVNSSTLDIYDAAIEDCSSRGGPAILIDNTSVAALHSGALIQNCHAINEGGAVRNSGTLILEDGSTIKNCTPQSGAAVLGGAVWNKGTVSMSGGEISGCSADKGGAIYNAGAAVYLSGGTITGNTATADPKNYDGVSATLGSAIYQGGTMYLSGAPQFNSDQDVYLPEGRVIIKNGEISAEDKIPVVLENEVRYRDILVSQTDDDRIVQDADLAKLNVKLSVQATAEDEGIMKPLRAVYSENGLDSQASPANVVELDVGDPVCKLIVNKKWTDGGNHAPVTIYLYENGVEGPVDSLVLSQANNWSGTFANLKMPQNGEPFAYNVSEKEVSGYLSSVGEIKPVDYWVPANPNTLENGEEYLLYTGGYVISRNGTDSATGRNISRGQNITIGENTYSSYISSSEVLDEDIWKAATYGSYYSLENDGFYLGANGQPTISTTRAHLQIANSSLIRLIDNRYTRYIGVSTAGVLNASSTGSAFTLYRKLETSGNNPAYIVNIVNSPITPISPDEPHAELDDLMAKQIDYLGDGEENPDTTVTGDDLYRLYLTFDGDGIQKAGRDLLLIVDGTWSMTDKNQFPNGDWPCTVLDEVVNGTITSGKVNLIGADPSPADSVPRKTDGLVYSFLNTNPDNRVGVVCFATYNTAAQSNGTVLRQYWTDKEGLPNGGSNLTDYFMFVGTTGHGTNYEAGYLGARRLLLEPARSENRPTTLVFLTDGAPNYYLNAREQDVSGDVQTCIDEAVSEFNSIKGNYPNIDESYIIGFTPSATTGDAGQRLAAMARRTGSTYYSADSAAELREALFNAAGVKVFFPAKITDELTPYVQLADQTDLKVSMTDPSNGNTLRIWDQNGATEDNLYNGEPIITSVIASGSKVEVNFNPDVKLVSPREFTLSYNVRTTDYAYDEFSENDGYSGVVGDEKTDYGSNETSSGNPGFRSNVKASATFYNGTGTYKIDYDHPVVQVIERKFTLNLRKVDAQNTSNSLAGAEFDLYKECSRTDSGSTPIPGVENAYWCKVNTSSIVSSASEDITLYDLSAGQYYLVEKKAPDGYLLLQSPVAFTLSSDGITTEDAMAEADENDAFILCVRNSAGYVLPETGGVGTHIYTLCGIAMMAAALMYGLSLRRKRERRYTD